MAMNPDTNEMEHWLVGPAHSGDKTSLALPEQLVRANGEPVPEHWSTYTTGEEVIVKGYRWTVAHIGDGHMLLEPVGPVLVGADERDSDDR